MICERTAAVIAALVGDCGSGDCDCTGVKDDLDEDVITFFPFLLLLFVGFVFGFAFAFGFVFFALDAGVGVVVVVLPFGFGFGFGAMMVKKKMVTTAAVRQAVSVSKVVCFSSSSSDFI